MGLLGAGLGAGLGLAWIALAALLRRRGALHLLVMMGVGWYFWPDLALALAAAAGATSPSCAPAPP